MIKIVDESPGDWKTVEEYPSDSIASDSDDEKKLRAAESRALRKKQNSRKSYQYSNIYSATPSATFNHRLRNVQQIQFPTQHSSPPIINAGRRTSSHTLTAATTNAPPSPMVDQIPQQHALRAGELDTKQLPLWKKFQKMKQNLLKISLLFCHLSILCLVILIKGAYEKT